MIGKTKLNMTVYGSESKFFFTTVLLSLIVNTAQLLDCPSYKPYKSSVGCVTKCPEGFVTNGSSCIITCGAWFTNKNRECQPICKENYYIKESLKAIGWYPYLEKECTDACTSLELVYNRTCLEACPPNYNYFVNNTCLQSCPDEYKYLINITKGYGIRHHKCMKTCPYLEDNLYCVDTCYGKLRFNSKCVTTCPKSNQFVDRNLCLQQCPIGRNLNVNKSCVSICPMHLSFIENNSCVASCSQHAPFIVNHSNGSKICLPTCMDAGDNQFILHNVCVSKCPSVTLNRTCLEKCPNTYSIIDNVTIGRNCQSGNICSEIFYYNACVNKCPREKFLLLRERGYVCVDMCPSNTVLKNRTCLNSCNGMTPYAEETIVDTFIWKFQITNFWPYRKVWQRVSKQLSILQCLDDCSSGKLYLNFTCVDECPMENVLQDPLDVPWNLTLRYLRHDRACIKACPTDKTFIGILYAQQSVINPCHSHDCNVKTNYFTCMANCPTNTYIFRNMCLSRCPSFVFDIENVCVEKCPSKRNFKIERELSINSINSEHSIKLSMFECVAACETAFISNDKCVKSCPISDPYIDGNICHNKTCEAKYELQTTKGIVCVTKCPNGTYMNLNKCSTSCPLETVTHKSSCLKTCPELYPYRFRKDMTLKDWIIKDNKEWFARDVPVGGHICLKACPRGRVVDSSLTCVEICPIKERYLDGIFCHNNTCRTQFENETIHGITCLDKCPNDTVYFKNKCLAECPENYKYILESTCIEKCPAYSKLVINTTVNSFSLKSVLHAIAPSKGLQCFSECPDWTLQHGNICTAICPDDLEYEFESKCVKSCPSSSQLIIDTTIDLLFSTHGRKSKFRCLSKCEKDEVYKQDDKRCISSYSCKYPYVIFDKQCLKHCPKGYKWFNGCFNTMSALISTICLPLMPIFFSIYCWNLFKETYKFIGKCRKHTKHDQNTISAEILWQHENVRQLNHFMEFVDTSSDVSADTLRLQIYNEINGDRSIETETNV